MGRSKGPTRRQIFGDAVPAEGNMIDDKATRQPRKKLPGWIRWMLVGAGMALAVPMTILGSMVLFNLLRPVELPPSLRLVVAPASSRRSPRGGPWMPAVADAVASPTASQAAERLVPESAVRNDAQRALADGLNEQAQRLQADVGRYCRDRAAWKSANDPDTLSPELLERERGLFNEYFAIKERLGQNFDRETQRRWNDAFLCMLLANGDWWLTFNFCRFERDFDNRETAVYCCRQMDPLNGAVMLTVLCAQSLWEEVASLAP
jgi:hypothetical protein